MSSSGLRLEVRGRSRSKGQALNGEQDRPVQADLFAWKVRRNPCHQKLFGHCGDTYKGL